MTINSKFLDILILTIKSNLFGAIYTIYKLSELHKSKLLILLFFSSSY